MVDPEAVQRLVAAGFDPVSVEAAVTAGDLKLLLHTGNIRIDIPPVRRTPRMTTPWQDYTLKTETTNAERARDLDETRAAAVLGTGRAEDEAQ